MVEEQGGSDGQTGSTNLRNGRVVTHTGEYKRRKHKHKRISLMTPEELKEEILENRSLLNREQKKVERMRAQIGELSGKLLALQPKNLPKEKPPKRKDGSTQTTKALLLQAGR